MHFATPEIQSFYHKNRSSIKLLLTITSVPSLRTSGCGGGESSRSHDFKMVVSDFQDDKVSSQAYIK